MEIISVIGMVLGVAVLIYLTFKGVNGFVASLVGSVIVIVSSGLPFWGTLTGTYAASLGSTFGSYLFLFTIGSAYSELMKKSGAAESIANFLFAFLGVKATVAGTLIITFLLAYGGVNAFIIIFAVYPVAVPMFRKANVSKLLMPAIFLYGAVVLNVVTPGAPSMLCIALSEKLGVTTFAAPTMAIVLLVVAFGFGIFYFTWASNSLRARGIGFVASESDAELIAGSTSGKELPPIHLAILPYIVIIVLKLVLANSMSASDGINTAMGVGAIVLIITNYKYLKGHIVQDLVTGFTSSINPLLLTAALMGFASVVNACAGFQYFMNFAMMLADKMNPYISAVIVTNVFSGITGASLSGTQIFCSTMADQFMSLGTVNPQALYKVVGMAAMGMDTLPHCPTFVMEAQVCGVTTKESYPHVLVMTVITPIALALIAATMAIIGLIRSLRVHIKRTGPNGSAPRNRMPTRSAFAFRKTAILCYRKGTKRYGKDINRPPSGRHLFLRWGNCDVRRLCKRSDASGGDYGCAGGGRQEQRTPERAEGRVCVRAG